MAFYLQGICFELSLGYNFINIHSISIAIARKDERGENKGREIEEVGWWGLFVCGVRVVLKKKNYMRGRRI